MDSPVQPNSTPDTYPDIQPTVIVSDGASPSPSSSSNPGAPGTKKKMKLAPIIATVFGLLIIGGGLVAGIALVNRQQLLNQQAANLTTYTVSCGNSQTNSDENSCTSLNNNPSSVCNGGETGTGTCTYNITLSQCSGTITCTSNSSGGGGTPAGNRCSNGCCNADSGFHAEQYTCDSHSISPCLNNPQNLGSGNHCANPSCGAIQLDLISDSGSDTGQATFVHAANDCTGGGGGSGGCSVGSCIPLGSYNGEPQTNCGQIGWGNGVGTCNGGLCCTPPNGGGGPTAPPSNLDCGSVCTSDSQCNQNPTGEGWPAKCINGTCQNPNCPGKTEPGENCTCSSLNACGQPCGQAVGLCQTGSTCRYIVGSACTITSTSNPTTYCIPTDSNQNAPAGWTTNACVGRDTGNSYVLDNGANPTVAQIQAACAPATPTPGAQCTNIAVYDTNWNQLSTSQLSSLAAGTTVYLTVTGSTTSGNFDMAQFTINGVQQSSVTTTKPGDSNTFYMQYTIPSGTTSFNITAQLHQQQLNQWF